MKKVTALNPRALDEVLQERDERRLETGEEPLGPKMTEGYTIGETDFECWDRLWKACRSDPEVDGEEWVTFVDHIQEHFRSNHENFPDEFYFWGDFSGDRTLDLKIAKPTVLTARLLSDLQKYLQMNGQKMWRIRIPIYFKPNDPNRVVVIYPHAIDIPPLTDSERMSTPTPRNCAAGGPWAHCKKNSVFRQL